MYYNHSMQTKQYVVYIMTNEYNSVYYIGVTSNLIKRIYEHKNKFVGGFTKRYNVTKLIYYEVFDSIENAITREKQLKHWNRIWKIALIKQVNPLFEDLYDHL